MFYPYDHLHRKLEFTLELKKTEAIDEPTIGSGIMKEVGQRHRHESSRIKKFRLIGYRDH